VDITALAVGGIIKYTINYAPKTTRFARFSATGTFTYTTGSQTSITLVGAVSVGTVSSVAAVVNGSNAQVSGGRCGLSSAKLEVLISGSWQSFTGSLVSGTT